MPSDFRTTVLTILLCPLGGGLGLSMAGCSAHLLAPQDLSQDLCGIFFFRVAFDFNILRLLPFLFWAESFEVRLTRDLLLVVVCVALLLASLNMYRTEIPFQWMLSLCGDEYEGDELQVGSEIQIPNTDIKLTLSQSRVPHGAGTLKFANGNTYQGEWQSGKQHGQGIFRYVNGDNYEGQWQNGLPQGKGIFTWFDGTQYIGEFSLGCPHGEGSKIWIDGARYSGQWKEGKKSGQGTYSWPSGREYTGAWLLDNMHGYGTCNYENGDKYAGRWANDTKSGEGTYRWADGSEVCGLW
mmetsp:Transcript_11292/g.17765  ORF Transcript_11292/g.17765 Transcript_11292/m.17765 type:complete len:296 (+) Transcript_11292:2-889(+)